MGCYIHIYTPNYSHVGLSQETCFFSFLLSHLKTCCIIFLVVEESRYLLALLELNHWLRPRPGGVALFSTAPG